MAHAPNLIRYIAAFLVPIVIASIGAFIFYSGPIRQSPNWLPAISVGTAVLVGLFLFLRQTKGVWWLQGFLAVVYLLLLSAILFFALLSVACTYGQDCL
jgi:hypothetical protein